MKQCFKIIFALSLFSNISFSQFYAEDEISPYIIEFMKIVDEFAEQNDPENKVFKMFTDAEIEQITDLYFKCYNDDPVGFQKYVTEKHKEWEKAPYEIGMKSMKLRMRPWMKVYALRDQIANKYGVPFTEVIGTPTFLRCRYINLMFSDYHSISMNTNFKVHNFIFLIEDIVKGNKFFSVNDTISILMIPNIESPSPEFIIGNSYLIPVGTLIGLQEGSFNIIFKYLHEYDSRGVMGKPQKTFPIENEIIKNCEYFGIKDTSWVDFKKFFKEKYLIFN